MSNRLIPHRTVHLPLSADGCLIRNSFGVIVARTDDPFIAEAMAQLANFGAPAAEALEATQSERESRLARSLFGTKGHGNVRDISDANTKPYGSNT